MSDSLWPHGLQHTRFLCPPLSPGVCSNSCPLNNRQIWSWSTEWSRAKAKRVLTREHTGQSKQPRPTTWTSPDGQHWNQIDYILCSQRWRSSIQTAKSRPGADCGSDHELLIAKFRLKLKKVGKTTRPFRYDLNQIPYDYTVEVTNRFKGLDLIVWLMTMDGGLEHCTGDRDQDHPQEKEMQKSKMAIWGGLTNRCDKEGGEKQRRKGKIYPFECRVPKNSMQR